MKELPTEHLESLRAHYRQFARVEAAAVSTLYADWAAGIAEDPEVLGLVMGLPRPKRQANLVFASARVHGTPLERWAIARTHVTARWDAIRATALERATQTNEPGRTAVLNTVLGGLEGPLALIEVGASAGLCLYPDAWPVRYRRQGEPDVLLSPEGSLRTSLELECTLTGVVPPPRLPHVVSRTGIDLNPLDATDPSDFAWLEALVWPGMEFRLPRLRAGAELVRQDPPTLLRGDLNARLAEALERVPCGATPVVFHSAVLVYLSREDRARFTAQVRDSGARWVSNEGAQVLPETGSRVSASDQESTGFVLALDGEPLAMTGPHGQFVRASSVG